LFNQDVYEMNQEFYNLILSRNSVRRYRQEKLDSTILDTIEDICNSVQPLITGNSFYFQILDYHDRPSIQKLGGTGKLMRPSHVLVPSMVGSNHVLEDLGYRTQQIVLGIWNLGIGSCYIGCVHHRSTWKNRISGIDYAQIVANVAFGYPSEGFETRIIKTIYDNFFNTGYRFPVEMIYFQHSFDHPSVPQGGLAKIINAGRMAPSAVNAQPWRFLDKDNRVTLYIILKRTGRIFDRNQNYAYHDAGVCMANMKVAADSLGFPLNWSLVESKDGINVDGYLYLPISYFNKPDDSESMIL